MPRFVSFASALVAALLLSSYLVDAAPTPLVQDITPAVFEADPIVVPEAAVDIFETASPRIGALAGGRETIILNKLNDGSAPYAGLPLTAVFDWVFDHESQVGNATAVSINGTEITKTMFCLGIDNHTDFMNTDHFSFTTPSGENVFAFRIILDSVTNGTFAAAMMLGEEGDVIVTSDDF